MTNTSRHCAECRHCIDDLCKHPQAKFHWGRYLNVLVHLPENKKDGYLWPKAPGWCGYFLPTDGWLVAFADRARKEAANRLDRLRDLAPKKKEKTA